MNSTDQVRPTRPAVRGCRIISVRSSRYQDSTERNSRCRPGTKRNSAATGREYSLCRRGSIQLPLRWKTVSRATSGAISGTTWTAVAPVPTNATRLPRRSVPWSQRAEWNATPAKSSMPSIAGIAGWLSWPVAITSAVARRSVTAPVESWEVTVQVRSVSSQAHDVTRASVTTRCVTPYLCATSSR